MFKYERMDIHTSLTVARKQAAGTEADMDVGLDVTPPDNTAVGELLEKYGRKVLPARKGQGGLR